VAAIGVRRAHRRAALHRGAVEDPLGAGQGDRGARGIAHRQVEMVGRSAGLQRERRADQSHAQRRADVLPCGDEVGERGADRHVLDAGDAEFQQRRAFVGDHFPQALRARGQAHARRPLRVFVHAAIERTGGVAAQPATRRHIVQRQAQRPLASGVDQHAVAGPAGEQHRAIRLQRIQALTPQGRVMQRVHVDVGGDPAFARLRLRGDGGAHRRAAAVAGCEAEVDRRQADGHVGMRIVDAGDHAPALEVDALGIGGGEFQDRRLVADRDDAALADRERGGRRHRGIAGPDLAVVQDGVDRRGIDGYQQQTDHGEHTHR
jgi:hypothetical protein